MTENSRTHTHVMEDGTVVEHSHLHTHTHTHQNTKAVLNRLSRASGVHQTYGGGRPGLQ